VSTPDAAALRRRLAVLQAAGRLPSVVAATVRDGRVDAVASVGDLGGAVAADRQYRIGSITKTLTAVLVLALRDEGRLELDDPIGRHVPGTGYAVRRVGDLLAHASGVQSEPAGPWWERSPGINLPTLLARNDGTGAVAGPGEFFHYSNLAYGLLGEAVARLHGASWWDVVRGRLLEPLGMDRTTWGPVAPHAQGLAVEHFTGRLVPEPHADTGVMAPAGQLWSTLADLATWGSVLAGRHPEVVSPVTLAEMARGRLDPAYGLGLRRMPLPDGRVLVGHTGSMPGFGAALFVDPGSGDGVAVLADATTGLVGDDVAPALLALGPEPVPVQRWVPTTGLPPEVDGLPGLWFWGQRAVELRWSEWADRSGPVGRLQLRTLQTGRLTDEFCVREGRLVGVSGYHRGETLHVHADHLECATFVYTRAPVS